MKHLLDLINENPNLPVFPIIYHSFVDWFDDNPFCDSTVGNIGNARIMRYCTYIIDKEIHFATEEDKEILEFEHPELILDWKEAIFFDVGYNDELFKNR